MSGHPLILLELKDAGSVSNDTVRLSVNRELAAFDAYLQEHLQQPMSKFERQMLHEYLHAKVRGLIKHAVDAETSKVEEKK